MYRRTEEGSGTGSLVSGSSGAQQYTGDVERDRAARKSRKVIVPPKSAIIPPVVVKPPPVKPPVTGPTNADVVRHLSGLRIESPRVPSDRLSDRNFRGYDVYEGKPEANEQRKNCKQRPDDNTPHDESRDAKKKRGGGGGGREFIPWCS